MLISDYLNQNGTQGAYSLIQSTPFWWPLRMAVKSPRDILHACSSLGLSTLEDLQAWIVAANSGPIPQREKWQALATPTTTIKPSDLGSCTWAQMDQARFTQCVSASDYKRMNSDAGYLCPTEAQLRQIAKDCPSWRLEWLTERNDCDDFVLFARGWLASQGLGNLSAGKAGTVHYAGSTILYGHAVLLAFSRETPTAPLVAWWWEPQNGELYPVTYTRLGANWLQWPDRVEIAWGDF